MTNTRVGSALLLFTALGFGQPPGGQMPRIGGAGAGEWMNVRGNPYRARSVTPIPFENSSRIESLLRGGNLYLSLPDAIALALENNLDVESQRLAPGMADSDLLRARGGGQLRGVALTATLLPAGVGGPASPLLNSATPGFTVTNSIAANVTNVALLSEAQNNLSISTGTFSSGAALPAYDPAIAGQLNWQHQTTPQANPFVTGASLLLTRMTSGNAGLVQGFSPGTQIAASFSSTAQNNNSIRSTLNPFSNSSFGLTLTQPLLRGFGVRLNRRFIRIAQNNRKVSDLVFRQQVIETVSGIARLYYDLVSLDEDVRVKRQTLALAQRLYEDNRVQVEQGTMASIELVRAQALIAASRQDLVNSEGLAREQELVLKSVLTRRGTADPVIRAARIVPTDPIPIPAQEQVQPVQDLVALALKTRPDLASANLQLASSEITLEGSRNQLLPDIEFIATATNSGLAGQVNPLLGTGGTPPDAAFLGGYGTALAQILRRNYPTYGVGLQINLPLRNRVAQADYVRDLLQLRQSEIRRQQMENQARLEVEDALVALQRSRAAYDAAVETRVYQEQSLAAEQERFAVGLSTTFLLIQYQSMLAQARSTEVAARGACAKALVALERATGRTLEDYGVSIEEAWRGQVSRSPTPIPPEPPGEPAATPAQ